MDDIIQIKVLFLGESGVGVTNIINRLIGKDFDPISPPTFTSSFSKKIIDFEGKKYEFDLWGNYFSACLL